MSHSAILTSARRALSIEANGMAKLQSALDAALGTALEKAVASIQNAKGRVIVSGMGKSGHIGRKIAATLASTGTPASFVHPAEASHGDLGMITQSDVVMLLSNSGESAELNAILSYCARFAVPMIAITANGESTMARAADIVLEIPKVEEACPNGLAPTTSTLLQLALGDAVAMALLEAKGFSADDFRSFHPGGRLGARIKRASDLMHNGDALPLVKDDSQLEAAIAVMSQKKFGCIGITDQSGKLSGLITDGDLRRNLSRNLSTLTVADIMTKNPKVIDGDMLAAEVIDLINTNRITAVFVVNDRHEPVGMIHIHDLLLAGVS
jgi:arabinose-5-phosphate isomerase